VLCADPAHKRINPVMYRLEEAEACWRRVTAPVLWVEGAQSLTPQQIGLSAGDIESRKRCFARLQSHVIADAGHMLHHDQPEALARVIEGFLAMPHGG
jgi:pimeloyl-ACP methyl ester carboxylesterase